MSQGKAGAPPANLQPTDDLVETFRRTGRPEDFERVVGRYAALVMAECRRVTRDAHDAEDAAQLAFLALAIELRSGTIIKRPAGWLQRVAKRQALKIVRSRGRRKRREDAVRRPDVTEAIAALPEADGNAAMPELIREGIDALPEKHRLPLVLHYFGGMTLDAIGGELGLTKTAVGTRLHRARKLLGERLAERGLTFDAGELSALVALLVPATVVASIARSSAVATNTTIGTAAFARGVSSILAATGGVIGTRPVAAAAAAVLGIAASGVAWVGPRGLVPAVRSHFNLMHWLDRIVGPPAVPRFQFVERSDDLPIPAAPHTTSLASVDRSAGYLSLSAAPSAFAAETFFGVAMPSQTIEPRAAAHVSFGTTPAALGETLAPPMTMRPVDDSFAAAPPVWPSSSPTRANASAPPAAPAELAVGSPAGESLTLDGKTSPAFSAVTLGRGPGDQGGIVQTGGQVVAGSLVVGERGSGLYDLRAGRLETGSLTIAAQPHSRGTVHIGGGELEVTDPSKPIEVGARGSGRLLLGTQDAPGKLTTATGADVPLIVRATASAQGLIQGWGDVAARGTLVNNGRVIADGFDHLRALNLSQASSVINNIDNAPDGTNGWYARRGGRVELPPIAVAAGSGQYTWGESADDPKLDLVNSLRLVAHDQPTATSLSISLRTIALADPLDVSLPSGVAIFGLWQLNADGSFNPSSLDTTIRYDHAAANGLFPGEFATRLIGFEQGAWTLAANEHLSLLDHLVTGTFDGPVKYLAVGIFWDASFRQSLASQMGTSAWASAYAVNAVTPEPSSLMVIAVGALIARRRRR